MNVKGALRRIFSLHQNEVEERAEQSGDTILTGDSLLRSLIGTTEVTKEMALEIPSIKSSINRICDTVASLPIKLYRQNGESVEEVKNDNRLFIINKDTGDKLTANQFWKAMITDYFLGKGGYAYIEKNGTNFEALHYVDESKVNVIDSVDPIFKNNRIIIAGNEYRDYEILKIVRNTKNGVSGKSIVDENKLAIGVGYYEFQYEETTLKKGGGRKGYLTSARELTDKAMKELKESFRNLYSNNNEEKVVVLNKGLEFQEASNNAVDMQLNQNKESNITQLSMLLNVPPSILKGNANATDRELFNDAVMTVVNEIEASLDRDLLTEKEKTEGWYYAIDTKELNRGNIKERYEAYEIALRNNFLQIDEVRKMEDLPNLGFNWIRLGLESVLLNPETMEIYTPNTGKWQGLNKNIVKGGEEDED